MSPIPLGIFAVAGASVASLPAYEQIATAFGTGSSNTITFSSIPSTYKHLQIRYIARTSGTGTSGDSITVYFNGDTSSNYSRHYLMGDGSATSSTGGGSTIMNYQLSVGSSATTNVFAPGIIDIVDYASTSKNKVIKSLTANQPSLIRLSSGAWYNTSAINTITLVSSGNHVTAARFSLYGIRG